MEEYNTSQAISDLNINENCLSVKQKQTLDDNGYCLIKISSDEWLKRGIDLDLISDVIDKLIDQEGTKGGWDHIKNKMIEGKHPEEGAQRLNNLISKHDCFKKIFTIPEAIVASKYLIKNDISLSQLILRMPLPGKGEQPWHVDWIPRKKKNDPIRSVLTSLLLDDYTIENGTTKVVPGSHKLLKQPSDEGYFFQDHPHQKYIVAPKGSLLIYDVNLWHCGTKNLNGKKRRHLNINYRDRIIWQQINFKKTLSEDCKNKFSEAEKYLLKIRKKDPDRNEWLFQKRNNFFIKKFINIYWGFLDRLYNVKKRYFSNNTKSKKVF
mgnify:FL=1|tara:strand:+ start:37 stop:1002 length:966 start_codon:yes stop_codon:yes gene_type:complete